GSGLVGDAQSLFQASSSGRRNPAGRVSRRLASAAAQIIERQLNQSARLALHRAIIQPLEQFALDVLAADEALVLLALDFTHVRVKRYEMAAPGRTRSCDARHARAHEIAAVYQSCEARFDHTAQPGTGVDMASPLLELSGVVGRCLRGPMSLVAAVDIRREPPVPQCGVDLLALHPVRPLG